MSKSDVGIYIHIPFCKSKCFYCDFNSFHANNGEFEFYKNILIKEISSFEKLKNYNIKSIFIGGGTPTIIPEEYINEILEAIFNYNINRDAEITIEANPGTLTYEKLKNLKSFGINRLSIGVQSLNNKILKNIGRIHTKEEFLKNYEDAISVGFNNINLDLIFSLPDQKFSEWKDTLKNIISLNPKHISTYGLILEEGTKFYEMYQNGNLNLVDDYLDRKMYYYAKEILSINGYEQYEISNFAKSGFESKHNIIYWTMENYKGFGLGAHSYLDGIRSSNTTNFNKYLNSDGDVSKLEDYKNILSEKDKIEEFMFLGLRLSKGISIEDFNKKFNKNIYDIYSDVIKNNLNKGLITVTDRIYLTEKGKDISNTVMADFLL